MAEILTGSLERVFSTLAGRGNVTVIVHLLGVEVLRFFELERAMPGISQRRAVYHQVPPRVEYGLTAWGRAFAPVLSSLRDWWEVCPKT